MKVISYCSVITCKNSCSANNPGLNGITFHKFPTDPSLQLQWIQATGRENWIPPKNSTICSQHFDADNFTLGSGERKLSDDAVPTINVAVVNDIIELDEEDEMDCDDQIINSNDLENDGENFRGWGREKLKRKVAHSMKMQDKYRQTIKCLNQKLNRQMKKLELQNKIINDLMEMYGLKISDITILKNEIMKADKA